MIDDISELQRAYNEAYGYLHSEADVKSTPYYLQELRKAYTANDTDRLKEILKGMKEETTGHIYTRITKEQHLENAVIKTLKKDMRQHLAIQYNTKKIEKILEFITTYEIADLVLTAIEGSTWITSLPTDDKPTKYKRRRSPNLQRSKTASPIKIYSYKKQLRQQRRILEETLKEKGVLDRDAQTISQILELLSPPQH